MAHWHHKRPAEPAPPEKRLQNMQEIKYHFRKFFEVPGHAIYDIPENGPKIASWIEHFRDDHYSYDNILAACKHLRENGKLMVYVPPPPPKPQSVIDREEEAKTLKPGQLSIYSSEQELRDASLEDVKDFLRRRRELEAKQLEQV